MYCAMTCPRCSGDLESTTLDDLGYIHNAHRCVRCAGLWVGPKQIDAISMTVEERWIEFHHVPSDEEQQVPLRCPACAGGVMMKKLVSPRDPSVVMDVCPTCKHVWLDHGEREAIEQESILRDIFSADSEPAS
jgi:Zn-finger nucleic acid-binding protein